MKRTSGMTVFLRAVMIRPLSLISLLFLLGPAAAQGDWKQRLFDEAPNALAKIEVYYSQMVGEVTVVKDGKSPRITMPPTRTERRFAVNGPLLRLINTADGEPERVLTLGKQCLFALHRTSASKHYVLEHVGTEFDKVRIRAESELWVVQSPYRVPFNTLGKLLGDPRFAVKEVTPVERDGTTYVSLECAYVPEKAPEALSDPVPFRGSLLLDPGRLWSIKESVIQTREGKVTCTTSVHYKTGQGEMPLVAVVQRVTTNVEGERVTETWTVRELRHAALPDSEFSLAAFGLPDVCQSRDGAQGTSAWWLLVGLTVASGLLAVGFYLYAKRGRQRREAF